MDGIYNSDCVHDIIRSRVSSIGVEILLKGLTLGGFKKLVLVVDRQVAHEVEEVNLWIQGRNL